MLGPSLRVKKKMREPPPPGRCTLTQKEVAAESVLVVCVFGMKISSYFLYLIDSRERGTQPTSNLGPLSAR